MGKFTKIFLVTVLSLFMSYAHAQDSTAATPPVATPAPAEISPVPGPDSSATLAPPPAAADTTTPTSTSSSITEIKTETAPAKKQEDTAQVKHKKDPQNMTQFMKPDMESKNYNFYQRKAISQPLMPRYDLDSAAFQKGKKKEKQQQSFLSRQYAFPARPRDMWELGVNFGSAFISGNVKPYVNIKGLVQNIGAGFTIRKALGYVLSLRGGYDFMMMTGRNWQPDGNLEFNQALHGSPNIDPRANYWNNPNLLPSKTKEGINMNKIFFYNYRCWVHEVHAEAVINLGNISYHRERNIANFYFLAGVSGIFFTTYMDAVDKNTGQPYDFSPVYALYYNNGGNGNVDARYSQRKQALKLLDGILTGNYTTPADRENDRPGFKGWQFVPAGMVGFGVQFHASRWVTVGIEERLMFTQAHMDGYRWQQDEHPALVSHYDNVSYTSLNLNIHLGNPKKRTEPLYWMNPVYHSYRKLAESDPAGMMAEMFKDDDDDGVPNYLDKEPNSKKGCPVDTHGVMIDSDHDGIIDCLDKEPYSPIGYPVDSNGVAIIPPNPCCDTGNMSARNAMNNNNLNNVNEPGGESGNLGGAGKRRGNAGYDCSKIELPAVAFDEDKYYLDPQYFGNLHQIAERMQLCPDTRLVVTGYDESRNDQKYNEQLGWNRANSAVDYLVEKYGISRDRFIIKYQGGKKAATGTPYEKKMKNKVEFRYANDGENGDSNPPAPHPGLKAGSNK